MQQCGCDIGPGKFESEPAVTFMAWEQAMLGNADITTGGEGSAVDWLRSPLNLDADKSVVEAARAYGYCEACVAEAGTDVRGGVAVWEDGQGFVGCRVFDTRKAFDKALAAAEAEDEADADYEDSASDGE